jgi:DNA-binding NarL/FixJ family response regulator
MPNTNPRHLVLIDDDSDDFAVLSYIIEQMKVQVRISAITNTENIADSLLNDKPDLILLDMAMPRKNGLECLIEIRQHHELASVPVIVYTDSRNQQEIRKAYDHGASLYIQKPSSYKEFMETMRNVLSLDLKIPQKNVPQQDQSLQES